MARPRRIEPNQKELDKLYNAIKRFERKETILQKVDEYFSLQDKYDVNDRMLNYNYVSSQNKDVVKEITKRLNIISRSASVKDVASGNTTLRPARKEEVFEEVTQYDTYGHEIGRALKSKGFKSVKGTGWNIRTTQFNRLNKELSERNKWLIKREDALSQALRTKVRKVSGKLETYNVEMLHTKTTKNRGTAFADVPYLIRFPNGKIIGKKGLSKEQLENVYIMDVNDASELAKVSGALKQTMSKGVFTKNETLMNNYLRSLTNIGYTFARQMRKLFKELNITPDEFLFLFATSDIFDFNFVYGVGEYRGIADDLNGRKQLIRSSIEQLRDRDDGGEYTTPGYQHFKDIMEDEKEV